MDAKNDFIIDALNIHGSFFHKKCIEAISNTENLSVIEKEFPVELDNEKTKIDIIAKNYFSNLESYFIIECKKADNNFKTWVFFPDIKHGLNDNSVIGGDSPLIIDTFLNLRNSLDPPIWTIKHVRYIHEFSTNIYRDINSKVCYDAYQIKFDYDKEGDINWNNIPKSANKKDIEDACNQVLLGTRGFVLHKFQRLSKQNNLTTASFNPIIVTTAKLLVVDVDASNVTINTGTIINKDKVKLIPAEWVIYNYKPNFMLNEINRIPFFPPKNVINDSIDYTMSVFIVNSESLTKFMKLFQIMS